MSQKFKSFTHTLAIILVLALTVSTLPFAGIAEEFTDSEAVEQFEDVVSDDISASDEDDIPPEIIAEEEAFLHFIIPVLQMSSEPAVLRAKCAMVQGGNSACCKG